ncbi:MAG TPA: GNAT family N-acetyltransferase [Anaerolineae bacterium]|nr:GNAT family N-acetyltransferase [Anaerolineae bacterium]
MDNVFVRSARADDFPQCLAIDPNFSTDYVWQMDSRSEAGQIAVAFRSARLPRSMQVNYPRDAKSRAANWPTCAAMLVGTRDHRVIGYAAISKHTPQSAAWLDDLVVAQSARRGGVGSALLEAAGRWGRAQRLKWLILEMQTKNYPAICFCQKHGLTFCGFSDRHFPNQDIALFFAQALHTGEAAL